MEIKDFFADSITGTFTVLLDDSLTVTGQDDTFIRMTGNQLGRNKVCKPFKSILSTNDFVRLRKRFDAEASSGSGCFQMELSLKPAEGCMTWGLFSFVIDEKTESASGTLQDISHLKKNIQNLKDQNQLLMIAMQKLAAIVWEYDFETRSITSTNPIFSAFSDDGVVSDVSETLLKNGCIHPDSLFPYLEMHEALQRGEPECGAEIRIKIKSPDFRWYSIKYTTIYDDETCEPTKAVGLAMDVNDQKERQLQYLMDMQYHDAMVSDAIYLMEINLSKNVVLKADSRLQNKLGSAHSLSYRNLVQAMAENLVIEEDRKFFLDMLSKEYMMSLFRCQVPNCTFEYRAVVTEGEIQWCRVSINFILEPLQGDICMLMYARNINDEKMRELSLVDGAERDSLTKLYNRATIQHKIDSELSHTMKNETVSVLYMIDLDDFKMINDTYGHLYGDAVLCEIAGRIKSVFPETDIIGRVGGDEFTVFLSDVPSLDFIREKASMICETLHSPMKFDAQDYRISGSVGVAVSPQCGMVFKDLYEKADEALYKAKSNGKNCFFLYNR